MNFDSSKSSIIKKLRTISVRAYKGNVSLNRDSATEENIRLGWHQVGMQDPVVRRVFLVDVGVVDGRANDEESAGDVHSVPEALVDGSLGRVGDGQRGLDGGGQQPAQMHRVLSVHKHDAIVLLCKKRERL